MLGAMADDWKKAFMTGLTGTGGLMDAGVKLGGKVLSGTLAVASGGIGGLAAMGGPAGTAISAMSDIGGMGYTKSEEYVDPVTGEKKTRDVEVSAAEAIGEQMQAFLDGFIIFITDTLPELLAEVIPKFIAEGVPALITGLIEAMPAIGKALFIEMPIAIIKAIGVWWHDAWEEIKIFFKSLGGLFGEGDDKAAEWGKAGAGAAAGAAAGSIIPGVGTALGGIVGFLAGAAMQTGGYVNRTGSYLLHQGERVVPSSGASTGTAESGLAAFAGGGTNVTINTNVVDPDSINRLGELLDQQFGAYGRNTVGVMG